MRKVPRTRLLLPYVKMPRTIARNRPAEKRRVGKKKHRVCYLVHKWGWTIGELYLENERVVILLNNIVSNMADLGPLRSVRYKHVEPEADVWVFPRESVQSRIVLELAT